jgi:hypothetical protein
MKRQMFRPRAAMAIILVFLAGTTHGQPPTPASAAPAKIYTRNKNFCLPIALDNRDRTRIQSVQLYVRTPKEPWMLRDSAPTSRTEFDYSVTQDGEYWFTIVTLKSNEKLTPVDLQRMAPGLIVVVDTQPPEVTIQAGVPTAQGVPIECQVRDANPDPARLKVEYQAADKTWHALLPFKNDPSVFWLAGTAMKETVVRATAADRAGNSTVRELTLDTASALSAAYKQKDSIPLPAPVTTQADKAAPAGTEPIKNPPPLLVEPAQPSHSLTPEPAPISAGRPTSSISPDPAPVPTGRPPNGSTIAPAPPGRQLINSTRVTLEFQIEQQGPTGVSKVEVWMTRDEGQTWRRLCEVPDHRDSVEFDLPGDGQYGITLVAINGSGFGAKPPARGEAPDYMVEVDTTKPVAQLLSTKPSAGDGGAVLLITWVASDKNLGDNPIDLYFATRKAGPWLPIAKALKNDGNYLWNLPADIGPEFYVRLEATDRAGNTERCESAQPVAVDMSKPKARVVRIRAGNKQ